MAFGIDDTVQQKVDAYRGNPGALQKRYAESKQLVDLLALQKMKSERDTISRDMKMKMQQNPKTIAQQYEEELAGQTKQEILKGVGGVMQNRQAKQQNNLQQVAQRGLPGAAPRPAPRPAPKQTLAQGGIVGLANGGGTRAAQREAIEADLKAGKITKEKAAELLAALDPSLLEAATTGGTLESLYETGRALVPKKIRDVASDVSDATGEFFFGTDKARSPVQSVLKGADDATRYVTGGIGDLVSGDYMKPAVDYLFTPRATDKGQAAADAARDAALDQAGPDMSVTPPVVDPMDDPTGKTGDNMLDGLGGPESSDTRDAPKKLPGLLDESLTPQTVTAGTINRDAVKRGEMDAGIAGLQNQNQRLAMEQILSNPEDKFTKFANLSDQRLNRSGIADKYASMQERLAALDKEQMDPDKLRNERLMATLLGAQGSTFAEALGSSGRAGVAVGRQQEMAKRQRMMDALNLETKAIDVDVTVGKEGIALGKAAYEQSLADRRQGQQVAQSLSESENKRLDAEADRLLRAEEADLTAKTRTDIANMQEFSSVQKANFKERGLNARAELAAVLDEMKILGNKELRMEIQRSTNVNALSNTLARVVKNIGDMYDASRKADNQYQMLTMQIASEKDAQKKAILQAELQKRDNELYLIAQKTASKSGSLDLRRILEDKVAELMDLDPTQNSAGISAGNVAGVTQVSP